MDNYSTVASTKYTISQINRITGKSRTTIASHLDAGKLSFETNEQGQRLVDASELMRVYGDECDFDQAEAGAKKSKQVQATASRAGAEPTSLAIVQQQLDKEVAERQREREQFERQIEHLQDSLKLAQEGQNKVTLLLEDRSQGAGEWEKALRGLEARVANYERRIEKEREEIKASAKRQVDRYRRRYEEEKNKPLLKKLFGSSGSRGATPKSSRPPPRRRTTSELQLIDGRRPSFPLPPL